IWPHVGISNAYSGRRSSTDVVSGVNRPCRVHVNRARGAYASGSSAKPPPALASFLVTDVTEILTGTTGERSSLDGSTRAGPGGPARGGAGGGAASARGEN